MKPEGSLPCLEYPATWIDQAGVRDRWHNRVCIANIT